MAWCEILNGEDWGELGDTALALLALEAEGPLVGSFCWDFVSCEGAGAPGVGAAGKEVMRECCGGEALAAIVGEREGAEVGEVSGFLGFGVGEEEIGDA